MTHLIENDTDRKAGLSPSSTSTCCPLPGARMQAKGCALSPASDLHGLQGLSHPLLTCHDLTQLIFYFLNLACLCVS